MFKEFTNQEGDRFSVNDMHIVGYRPLKEDEISIPDHKTLSVLNFTHDDSIQVRESYEEVAVILGGDTGVTKDLFEFDEYLRIRVKIENGFEITANEDAFLNHYHCKNYSGVDTGTTSAEENRSRLLVADKDFKEVMIETEEKVRLGMEDAGQRVADSFTYNGLMARLGSLTKDEVEFINNYEKNQKNVETALELKYQALKMKGVDECCSPEEIMFMSQYEGGIYERK